MARNHSKRKGKNQQHVQVFVRVKPANQNEIKGKSKTVVEVPSSKEVIVRKRPRDKVTKKVTFERVFGPNSKQLDVYTSVVSPLIDEVLAGYNCTVFAYGQTGSGKTWTMKGVDNDPSLDWQSDSCAGIIPRALSHIFDKLRMLINQDYVVKVSYLELYNEELLDLLSSSDEDGKSKIQIYEDSRKKNAVIVNGLEEVTVNNKNEVYQILDKGSEKRKTLATLMNAPSSKSHTILSITIQITEKTAGGEELLRIGKLNLVDLAGSENIVKSKAVKRLPTEAKNINKSLLTFGRVITSLVERARHIPYRESKLTRLLQESLGGRTKTSIIATVSPASINLEETLSTLDYAHRAKNITNRPEINQILMKKSFSHEFDEKTCTFHASHKKHGMYIDPNDYNEMQNKMHSMNQNMIEITNDLDLKIKTLDDKNKTIKDLEEIIFIKDQQMIALKKIVNEKNEQINILDNKLKVLVNNPLRTIDSANGVHSLLDVIKRATQDFYTKISRAQKDLSGGLDTNCSIVEQSIKPVSDAIVEALQTDEPSCSFKKIISIAENSIQQKTVLENEHKKNELIKNSDKLQQKGQIITLSLEKNENNNTYTKDEYTDSIECIKEFLEKFEESTQLQNENISGLPTTQGQIDELVEDLQNDKPSCSSNEVSSIAEVSIQQQTVMDNEHTRKELMEDGSKLDRESPINTLKLEGKKKYIYATNEYIDSIECLKGFFDRNEESTQLQNKNISGLPSTQGQIDEFVEDLQNDKPSCSSNEVSSIAEVSIQQQTVMDNEHTRKELMEDGSKLDRESPINTLKLEGKKKYIYATNEYIDSIECLKGFFDRNEESTQLQNKNISGLPSTQGQIDEFVEDVDSIESIESAVSNQDHLVVLEPIIEEEEEESIELYETRKCPCCYPSEWEDSDGDDPMGEPLPRKKSLRFQKRIIRPSKLLLCPENSTKKSASKLVYPQEAANKLRPWNLQQTSAMDLKKRNNLEVIDKSIDNYKEPDFELHKRIKYSFSDDV